MTATEEKAAQIREALIIPVAVVVLLAWTASLGVAVLQQAYTPLTITTPVMLLLAGYVFGVSIVKSAVNKPQKENGG